MSRQKENKKINKYLKVAIITTVVLLIVPFINLIIMITTDVLDKTIPNDAKTRIDPLVKITEASGSKKLCGGRNLSNMFGNRYDYGATYIIKDSGDLTQKLTDAASRSGFSLYPDPILNKDKYFEDEYYTSVKDGDRMANVDILEIGIEREKGTRRSRSCNPEITSSIFVDADQAIVSTQVSLARK